MKIASNFNHLGEEEIRDWLFQYTKSPTAVDVYFDAWIAEIWEKVADRSFGDGLDHEYELSARESIDGQPHLLNIPDAWIEWINE